MPEFHFERSAAVDAPPEIIACQWANWDIYDAALGIRFGVQRMHNTAWRLSYKRIRGVLTLKDSSWGVSKGKFHYDLVANGFGVEALHTIELSYVVADDARTLVTGKVSAAFGLFGRLIARFVRGRVENILDEVLAGGGEASKLLADPSGKGRETLDSRQREILAGYEREATALRYRPVPIVLNIRKLEDDAWVTLETSTRNSPVLDNRVPGAAGRPPLPPAWLDFKAAQMARRRGPAGGGNPPARSYDEAVQYGKSLFAQYLSADMRARISAMLERPDSVRMQICVSGALESAPWELLHTGHDFLCLRVAVLRRVSCVGADEPKILRSVSALVVGADPDGDLTDVADEMKWAAESLEASGASVSVLEPRDATKANVIKALHSRVTVLHYAGHSVFDAESPSQSHLRLADDRLYAYELGRIAAESSLALVFLNSCESASGEPATDGAAGLAHTLLKDGVGQVLGMRWGISDEAGSKMGRAFYSALAQGEDVAVALRHARREAGQVNWNDLTWLAPVLYV